MTQVIAQPVVRIPGVAQWGVPATTYIDFLRYLLPLVRPHWQRALELAAYMALYFLVEPNGDVAHGDLFIGDPLYTLGNVMRDDWRTIRTSPNLRRLRAENAAALEVMRTCPEFGVCNGWCPHERYNSLRHNPDHRAECCGMRTLIDYLRERESSVEDYANDVLPQPQLRV